MAKRFKILIVDDDRNNVQVLSSALRDEYHIFTALNGNDAISLVKELTPNLILLDSLPRLYRGALPQASE